jgi:hypothetical protein
MSYVQVMKDSYRDNVSNYEDQNDTVSNYVPRTCMHVGLLTQITHNRLSTPFTHLH